MSLTLEHRPGALAICRLAATDAVPAWAVTGDFHAVRALNEAGDPVRKAVTPGH